MAEIVLINPQFEASYWGIAMLFVYLIKCILHYHYVALTRNLVQPDRAMINTI